ncbi:MAG: hypothetical protein AAF203_11245, partial [Pseudomonadota bacterium]
HQRNQAIVHQFIETQSDPFKEDCDQLKKISCQKGDYGYYSALDRIGFEEKSTGFLEHLQKFWRKHFFANEFLHHDAPMPGAVEWVQNLEKNHIPFYYLTARHKDSMWPGTLQSMANLGFPISEKNLFLKEDLSVSDETYKSLIFSNQLSNRDRKRCLIDNEPVVLNKILNDHPDIALVWFRSTHSGKMEPPPSALEIQDFNFK